MHASVITTGFSHRKGVIRPSSLPIFPFQRLDAAPSYMGQMRNACTKIRKCLGVCQVGQECFGFGCVVSFLTAEQPRPLKSTVTHLECNLKIGRISVTIPVTRHLGR